MTQGDTGRHRPCILITRNCNRFVVHFYSKSHFPVYKHLVNIRLRLQKAEHTSCDISNIQYLISSLYTFYMMLLRYPPPHTSLTFLPSPSPSPSPMFTPPPLPLHLQYMMLLQYPLVTIFTAVLISTIILHVCTGNIELHVDVT